ncbi:hypothetical protein NPIL_74121, partial [Nephila pilipes]
FIRRRIPKRFIVTILGFFGVLNMYAMRVNLSVAIVSMVNTSAQVLENKNYSLTECPAGKFLNIYAEQSEFKAERYNWDYVTQSQIMSAFFYLYFLSLVFGGYIAEKIGAQKVYGAGVFFTSFLTLLTPVIVRWGVTPFIVLRALEGLGEGITFPAMTSVISQWAPKMERSRITSIIYSGTGLGGALGMSLTGWLCSTNFLGGWPSVFYAFGTFGCLWVVFWCILVYESPFKHPYITERELSLYKDNTKPSTQKPKVPWFAIFTSIPFWVLLSAYCGYFFADTILYVEMPTYLSRVLHIDVHMVGLLMSIPCIVLSLGSWVGPIFADKLRKSGKLSITSIRKIFNSI